VLSPRFQNVLGGVGAGWERPPSSSGRPEASDAVGGGVLRGVIEAQVTSAVHGATGPDVSGVSAGRWQVTRWRPAIQAPALLHAGHKHCWAHTQGARESNDVDHGYIALAALDPADVRAVEARQGS
jgi:hypothetical protein